MLDHPAVRNKKSSRRGQPLFIESKVIPSPQSFFNTVAKIRILNERQSISQYKIKRTPLPLPQGWEALDRQ